MEQSMDDGAIDVTDFEFHSLRKIRLFEGNETTHGTKRIAISRLGVGVVLGPDKKIISFNTSSILMLKKTKTNLNEEVTDLQTKKCSNYDASSTPVQISCNCEGTVFAILVNTVNGPFVDFFDAQAFSLSYKGQVWPFLSVRVTADASARGTTLEWNPAVPDVLAVASSDRMLMTLTISLTDPSKYSVLGQKKLGAEVCSISWSRKGKQLVVGDSVGKVTQLKPETDIVRSTMPSCSFSSPYVCGLSWLSTTEFLVVYAEKGRTEVEANIMSVKKGQPVHWTRLSDLFFGSDQSTFDNCYASLVLDWDIVVLASSRLSEVTVVGLRDSTWRQWALDDACGISLPTDSSQKETFPIGIDVDFTATEQLILSEDGLKKAPASPVVLVLSSNGVLIGYHAVTYNAAHPSLQKTQVPVNVDSVRVGNAPPGVPLPVIGDAIPHKDAPTEQAVFKPSIVPVQQPKSSVAKALFTTPPTSTATPPVATPPTSTATPPVTRSPLSTITNVTTITPTAQVIKPREEPVKENTLVMRIQETNGQLAMVHQLWMMLAHEMKQLEKMKNDSKPTFDSIREEFANFDVSTVLGEMSEMASEIESQYQRLERRLRDAIQSVTEKMEMMREGEQNPIEIIRAHVDYDRDECMRRLHERVAEVQAKYAMAVRDVRSLEKNPNLGERRTGTPLTQMDRTTEENIKGTVRRIRKIIDRKRCKLDELETYLKALDINNRKQHGVKEEKNEEKEEKQQVVPSMCIEVSSVPSLHNSGDVQVLRNRMRKCLATLKPTKSVEAAKTRQEVEERKTDTSLLESRLLELSTPRKTLPIPDLSNFTLQSPPPMSPMLAAAMRPPMATSTPKQPFVPAPSTAPSMLTPKVPVTFAPSPLAQSKPVENKVPQIVDASKTKSLVSGNLPPEVTPRVESSAPSLFTSITSASVTSPLTALSKPADVTSSLVPAPPVATSVPDKAAVPATVTVTSPVAPQSVSSSLAPSVTSPPSSSVIVMSPASVAISSSSSTTTVISSAAPTTTTASASGTPLSSLFAPKDTSASLATSPSQEPAKSSSIFGGGVSATSPPTVAAAKPSIFGGGLTATQQQPQQQQKSMFGGGVFGSPSSQPTTTPASSSIFGGSKPNTASSFSFLPKTDQKPAASAFNFNQGGGGGGGAASGFAAAAAQAAADEGMMEEENGSSGGGGGFFGSKSGGGFMGGLGLQPSSNANRNVFGGGMNLTQMTQKPAAPAFGGGTQARSGTFAAAAQTAAASSPPSIFGGSKPTFGGGPSFGAKPAFGGGMTAPQQTQQAPNSGAFSAFAGRSAGFGGLGSGAPAQPTQSLFGSNTQNKTSFTAWR